MLDSKAIRGAGWSGLPGLHSKDFVVKPAADEWHKANQTSENLSGEAWRNDKNPQVRMETIKGMTRDVISEIKSLDA